MISHYNGHAHASQFPKNEVSVADDLRLVAIKANDGGGLIVYFSSIEIEIRIVTEVAARIRNSKRRRLSFDIRTRSDERSGRR